MAPGVVIDGNAVHAFHVHFAVRSHHGLTGSHSLSQNAVQIGGGVGIDHDHVDLIVVDKVADNVGLLICIPVGGVVDDLVVFDAPFSLVFLGDLCNIVDAFLPEGGAGGAGGETNNQVASCVIGAGGLLLLLAVAGVAAIAAAACGQSQKHQSAE